MIFQKNTKEFTDTIIQMFFFLLLFDHERYDIQSAD